MKAMMSRSNKKRKLLSLAWVPYIFILFEMLYMATPFAAFFYGAYEIPLKFLNESPVTARLIQTILPHFVETNSKIIHLLISAGWILMGIGSVAFIVGFVQIYYSKFTKKEAVTGGIYKVIRHPQYAAWILFGLGMSLVWSRLVVWIMFVSMTFIYYLLAKAEEKECMEKYPETYPRYYNQTGMFFPKILNTGKIKISLPDNKILYGSVVFLIYVGVVSITILSAISLRNYTISKMSTYYGNDYLAVSVTYISPQITQKAIDIMIKDITAQNEISKLFGEGDKKIFYVMPQSWIFPELGMVGELDDHNNPERRSASHGNPKDTEPTKKRILVSKPKLIRETI